MDQSMRIINQVQVQLENAGPVLIDDPSYAAPPKEALGLSMEALIHHFKLVSESYRVPPGDVYQSIESPRGEMGFYLVSNGDNRPWRVRQRPPSLYNLQVLKRLAVGEMIADLIVVLGSLDPVFGEVDR
jgi:NADH-quinone oxidoreductase subunit D